MDWNAQFIPASNARYGNSNCKGWLKFMTFLFIICFYLDWQQTYVDCYMQWRKMYTERTWNRKKIDVKITIFAQVKVRTETSRLSMKSFKNSLKCLFRGDRQLLCSKRYARRWCKQLVLCLEIESEKISIEEKNHTTQMGKLK